MIYETLDHWDNNRIVPIAIGEDNQISHQPGTGIFSFSVLRQGRGFFQIDDEVLETSAPAFICLDDRRSVSILSADQPRFLTVYFSPVFLNVNMTPKLLHSRQYENFSERFHFNKLYPFLSGGEQYSPVLSPDEHILEATVQKIYLCAEQLHAQFDFYWSCRARSYFMEILEFLELLHRNTNMIPHLLEIEESQLAKSFPYILSYINSNLEKNLTLQNICTIFGTNRTDLEKIFNSMLNMTFYHYVTDQRIQRALSALRFTELPLAEIAYQSGFSSIQNFCKFFKQKMNLSPNKYRKMQVQERIDAMRRMRRAELEGAGASEASRT